MATKVSIQKKGGTKLLRFRSDERGFSVEKSIKAEKHTASDAATLTDIAKEIIYHRQKSDKLPFSLRERIKEEVSGPALKLFTKVGLVQEIEETNFSLLYQINKVVREFYENRYLAGEIKKATFLKRKKVAELLIDLLGGEMDIRDVQPHHGNAFHELRRTKNKVSDETFRKELSWIRSIFDQLVLNRIIPTNPFKLCKFPAVAKDESRRVKIPKYLLDLVEYYLEDTSHYFKSGWRIYFLLLRYLGARRNEPLLIKWKDVDFDALEGQGKVRVPSPKTAKTKPFRYAPLFNGWKNELVDCNLKFVLKKFWQDSNQDPEEYVVQGILNLPRKDRSGINFATKNSAQTLAKIFLRAGVAPPPKLAQNLRVTREDELLRSRCFSPAAIHKMIGHSPATYLANYSVVDDSDLMPHPSIDGLPDVDLVEIGGHTLHYSPKYSPSISKELEEWFIGWKSATKAKTLRDRNLDRNKF